MDIVFMGTPDFAVPTLEILIKNNINVKAIVTATDKFAGRGKQLKFSDIKKFAIENNLPILQPEKLKNQEFIDKLKEFNADLFIVVAFRMLPKEVWTLPKFGTINLHAALLPNYRGAAPINHAIINGETKTGLTTFFIDENIDTGKIILQEETIILLQDNFGTLYDKMKIQGAKLVLKTVNLILEGNFKTINQEDSTEKDIKLAPKIEKEFCEINWNQKSETIHNFVRGLSPSPCAFFYTDDQNIIKIYKTSYIIENHDLGCGKIITDNKTFLKISTTNGFIFIEELQTSGKKRMDIKSFLLGNKIFEINKKK